MIRATSSIQDTRPTKPLLLLFRILTRLEWNRLQEMHRSFPGSAVEHVAAGIFVLHIKPGGARRLEA
jgi:hypothetical protein